MPEYAFALCDMAGVEIADVRAPVTPTFTRNQPPSVEVTLQIEDDVASKINATLPNGFPRLKAWWRDEPGDTGVLILNAPWAPHQEDAQDFDETSGTMQAAFRGPFWLLEGRDTSATFTAEDAGQLAWSLIDTSNTTEGPTGIRIGTIAATINRDQAYANVQVAQAITDLAAMDGGFDFEVSPVDEGLTCGAFNVYGRQGTDLSDSVVFEYGPGTIGNVRSAHRETTPPVNRVLSLGANGLTSDQQDAGSIARYGTFKIIDQATDVTDQASLDARARSLLRPDMVQVVSFVPDPDLAPQPIRDFWLGDTVTFRARHGSFIADLTPRINVIAPTIDEDGNVSQLSLTVDQAF